MERRRPGREFKLEAVRLVRERGVTVAQAARDLRAAFEGWKKSKTRPQNTLDEDGRALDIFIELHGDLPVAQITRSHARQFREALQEVPRRRTGKLLKIAPSSPAAA